MVVSKLDMIPVNHSYWGKCHRIAHIVTKFQRDCIINELTAYDQNKSGQHEWWKMATSYTGAEQWCKIQFYFESGMTPLDTLN